MRANTGKYTLSVKVLGDASAESGVTLGVAPDDTEWDRDPFVTEEEGVGGGGGRRSFGMWLGAGMLEESDHASGQVCTGQTVTMDLDTDAHTLKFWVDGKPHGPGFTSRVKGSLRWAMNTLSEYDCIQIVSSTAIVLQE
jgi:hypothetical protein